MLKNIGKRLVAFALIFAMIGSFLPILPSAAQAADSTLSLSNSKIGATYSGGTWRAENDVVKGSVTGKGGTCSSTEAGTLTLTNTLPIKATLSFEVSALTLNNGTAVINGTNATKAVHSFELESQQAVTVKIESAKAASTTSIELKNFSLTADVTNDVTFEVPTNGQITVNGGAIATQTTIQASGKTPVALEATPDADYKFVGWFFNGKMVSNQASLQQTFYEKTTVEARFVAKNLAVFKVGESIFSDLNVATQYAVQNNQKTIILIDDGEVPAGEYTIPNGVTLLVPMDNNYDISRETPIIDEKTYNGGIKQYSCLTLAQGATLNIASGGAVSVVAKQSTFHSIYIVSTGGPVGNYGRIDMQANSAINVQDGGKLFVSGFITGDGEISALSGATVYENCEISDYKGGSATLKLASTAGNKKVFPFGQYHVQNIQSRMKLYAGAKGYAVAAMYPSFLVQAPVELVGENGLYQIKNGYMEKSYDPSKDLSSYAMHGDVALERFIVKISSSSIDSTKFVLMVPNNTALSVHEGYTLSILHDFQFTPGTSVSIDKGAKVVVGNQARVFILDQDEWKNKYFAQWKDYAPAANWPGKNQTYDKISGLPDAVFDVNGEFIIEGQLYTSQGGADIKSSGKTGVTSLKTAPKAPTATELYEVTNAEVYQDDTKFYQTVPLTEAKLHNGAPWSSKPEEYTATAGSVAGSIFNYNATEDRWVLGEVPKQNITWMNGDTKLKQESLQAGQVPSYTGDVPTKDATNLVSYEFLGWNTDKNATTALPTPLPVVSGETTYYAIFKAVDRKYNVTWMNGDTQLKKEEVTVNQIPAYSETNPTKDGNAMVHYEFLGWNTNKNATEALQSLPAVSGDVTYHAIFKEVKNKYAITWMNGDTQLKQEEVIAGDTPAYSDADPTKDGTALVHYEFLGWHTNKNATEALTALPKVNAPQTYYAIFKEVKNKYAITWMNGDTQLKQEDVVAGETPTYKDAEPTKPETKLVTYKFLGWHTDKDATDVMTPLPEVTAAQTYYAIFQAIPKKYQVTWMNDKTELAKKEVVAGQVPTFGGTTPIKAETALATYNFIGWHTDKTATTALTVLPTIEDDTVLYAIFQKVPKTYDITWKNGDDVLKTDTVTAGQAPAYTGATPTKTGTVIFHYEFLGWHTDKNATEALKTLPIVDSAQTYYAIYKEVKNPYPITWMNGDTQIKQEEVSAGEVPSYKGDTPTKAGNKLVHYEFLGWNTTKDATEALEELPVVTSAQIYYAVFREVKNTYDVTWMNGDTKLKATKVTAGELPTFDGDTPSKPETKLASYKFLGWNTDKNATEVLDTLPVVEGEQTYYAIFQEIPKHYAVIWKNGDTLLKTDTVKAGDTPVYNGEQPTKNGSVLVHYDFLGWNTDKDADAALTTLQTVEGAQTYYAIFKEVKNSYKVKWMNGDSEIKTEDVVAGSKPKYEGAAPEKAETPLVRYEFLGWHTDKNTTEALTEFPDVTSTQIYYAIFKEVAKTYTVTYHANGGTGSMSAETITAGSNVNIKSNAFKQKGYVFKEWNTKANGLGTAYKTGTSLQVLENIDLYAQWKQQSVSGGGGGGFIPPNPNGQSYKVIPVDNDNQDQGTMTLSAQTAIPEQVVTITVVAAAGYQVAEVQVTDAEGKRLSTTLENGRYQFNMPNSDAKVSVTYKKATVPVSPDAVPSRLNSTEHFAYIYGYPDGTIHPTQPITRAEVTAIFDRLLQKDIRAEVMKDGITNPFNDVQTGDWYYEPVSVMSQMEIVKGRDSDIFAPNSFITRAEFAAIAARFADKESGDAVTFNDTTGHWAEANIQQVAGFGWIAGYEDGSFRPDNNITRAEVMAIINRMLLRMPESTNDLLPNMTQWRDNSDPNAWYYLTVQEATNSHTYERVGTIHEKWTALVG